MGYISKEGLDNIANWKYVGGEYTYLDNFLNPFWLWGATLIPRKVSPNMVSLSGLLCTMSAAMLIIIYDVTLTTYVPTWLSFYGGFAVFMFQTLDAIDGKHARNTNTSSPLGQLFDHGCDAVNTPVTLLLVFSASALMTRPGLLLYMYAFSVQIFYLAQWEEYHSRVNKHSVGGVFGVTEGQLMGVLVCACHAATNYWSADLLFSDVFDASTFL
jgi:ethanolaminephosphotransferase